MEIEPRINRGLSAFPDFFESLWLSRWKVTIDRNFWPFFLFFFFGRIPIFGQIDEWMVKIDQLGFLAGNKEFCSGEGLLLFWKIYI